MTRPISRRAFAGTLAAGAAALATGAPAWAARPARRPNVVLIMADDMGFSDIGPYGGEIHTPNLDRLAREGMRFSQFYNAARCVPTRGALLTGVYPHQAGVGHMNTEVTHGYEGQLSRECVTLAEVLRPAGYATGMSGKWHLSHRHFEGKDGLNFRSNREFWDSKASWPGARGFDEFYGTIAGAGSFFDPYTLVHNTTVTHPESADFYYTDAIAEHAARTIAARADQPFFHYVAFTAPHWPLQARPEDVARYRGVYAAGWDEVRRARVERLRASGLFGAGLELAPREPGVPAWSAAPHREWEAERMAVYAAMVDRMDRGIGRILDALRDSGAERDTLVLFLSDNGASDENVQAGWGGVPTATRAGDTVRVGNNAAVPPGPATTFESYGGAWANASNTPFRLYKKWLHEGGIATPLIARWPAAMGRGGTVTHQPGHVIDVMATVLEMAGARYPRHFGGRSILPLEGRSLLPVFQGRQRAPHPALFWEHEGSRAVRAGDWKLVRQDDHAWELYDLRADRTELHDRAAAEPARVRELAALHAGWMARAGVLPWDEYQRRLRARREEP